MIVPAPETTITVQEIYDQARDYEDEPGNMDLSPLVDASGKNPLGGGEFVGITLTLINDWRLQFEARGGPDTVSCTVSGGNLIAENSYDDNPIAPSAFTQVQIRQSASPSILNLEDVTAALDLMQADEELSASTAIWRHKTTKAILKQKNVTGGDLTGTVTLDE